ncbi:alpha/beta fold hydrolase [Pseudonocardia charpentierae]|uniref:Alpha/beta hydrolase n=1 Tax=Pseudonocardia charpentierae TaxID=3075545 RepID=A0ABU2NJC2_9PSEU|nr:alpha/beta hydrolase [Pseudonocardia sp. DSM 45834]MDT0354075.1 alpha/beta hydrolase [Pseudonocardia sp. DSM 45834]
MTTDQLRPAETPRIYAVPGGNGVRLHVREWGRPDGPAILLVHGWSQGLTCWRHQVEGDLAAQCRVVALDIRGHGMSERPREADAYQDANLWAMDIAAVLDQLELQRPVLVGWSYGGSIIADYLRVFGQGAIAAVNLVGAAMILNDHFDHIGPGLLDNVEGACSPDLTTGITAVRHFLRACTVEAMDPDDWDSALCTNMVVRPDVRAALLARHIDCDDVLAKLTVPVLVSHGMRDTLILPSMAEHVVSACPSAVASWYDDVGHAPFLERPLRFDRELLDLVRRANVPH